MQCLLYYMQYIKHEIKEPTALLSSGKYVNDLFQISLSISVYIQQGKTEHALRSHGATEVCLHPSHCRKRPLRCCCRYWHAEQNEQNEKTSSNIGV
ncbi:hypothetical protein DPMN_060298 [Dreissena polymorpha]|uniref:Uncharacterized protein n=1 Tax=Dreissena polymorpha TaxID=45954 RepID=A0A9D4C5P3_DREPO|nr:hypothetical protein DPMN_060298 [Dreissena polymorpha]